MTCIAAVTVGGRAVLGGDACMSDGDGDRWTSASTKVWRAGPFLIGYAGSTEYGQLLRYRIKWPTLLPIDLERYFLIDLPDYLRETYKRLGEDFPDGAALIATDSTLWSFNDDVCDQISEGYGAVGSGCAHALGALYASAGRSPVRRVTLALEAAARHRTDVAPPFTVLRL